MVEFTAPHIHYANGDKSFGIMYATDILRYIEETSGKTQSDNKSRVLQYVMSNDDAGTVMFYNLPSDAEWTNDLKACAEFAAENSCTWVIINDIEE